MSHSSRSCSLRITGVLGSACAVAVLAASWCRPVVGSEPGERTPAVTGKGVVVSVSGPASGVGAEVLREAVTRSTPRSRPPSRSPSPTPRPGTSAVAGTCWFTRQGPAARRFTTSGRSRRKPQPGTCSSGRRIGPAPPGRRPGDGRRSCTRPPEARQGPVEGPRGTRGPTGRGRIRTGPRLREITERGAQDLDRPGIRGTTSGVREARGRRLAGRRPAVATGFENDPFPGRRPGPDGFYSGRSRNC